MPCSPQKSSSSCVSAMPPMSEPADGLARRRSGEWCRDRIQRRPGSPPAPGRRLVASVGDIGVEVMRVGHRVDDEIELALRRPPSAPRRWRSRLRRRPGAARPPPLPGERVNIATSAPSALASLTPCGRGRRAPPRRPCCPCPTFQWRSGDQVVMPAQSSGAAPLRSSPVGTFSDEALRDHDVLGIAAVGRRLVVPVHRPL